MGENSAIQWTDHTWNPWIGCQRVSAGCQHCYAESFARRYGKAGWGPTAERKRTSDANWRKPIVWNRKAAQEGRRYKVFCSSLADVFEANDQLTEWRRQMFSIIEDTPHLDWLLLTKRPENIADMVPGRWRLVGRWPQNVWLGTSVEDQKAAEKRIPILRRFTAPVLFLSCEPLLGPLDLQDLAYEVAGPGWAGANRLIDWIICGGESGPAARPMHPDWARSLRDQCVAAGISYFYKQHGTWLHRSQVSHTLQGDLAMGSALGGTLSYHKWDDGTDSIKLPGKEFAGTLIGRQLDGREWNEMPVVE